MMAVNLSFIGGAGWQFFDDNGNILIGGKIYTYAAGTTTPLATYTSRTGLVANTNPIILDSSGRTPQQIWSTEGLLYKYVVKDSNDATIRTWDNIGGSVVASDLAQDLAAPSGSSLVGFLPDGGVARTVQSKLRDTVSVKDFGAVGDGVTNDTSAIQNAINSNQSIIDLSGGVYSLSSKLTFSCAGQTIQNGTLLFNGTTSERIGNVTANNVTFDNVVFHGNEKQPSSSLIWVADNVQRPRFIGCIFKKLTGRAWGSNVLNGMYAVLISPYGVLNFEFRNCLFQDLLKYNDGTGMVPPTTAFVGGGFVGAVCFLPENLAPGSTAQTVVTQGTIEGCTFDNIQTIRAASLSINDQIEFNDADAIRTYGDANTPELRVHVSDCVFKNVSKRCFKFRASGSVAHDNECYAADLPYQMTSPIDLTSNTKVINLKVYASAAMPVYNGITWSVGPVFNREALVEGLFVSHATNGVNFFSNLTFDVLRNFTLRNSYFNQVYAAGVVSSAPVATGYENIVIENTQFWGGATNTIGIQTLGGSTTGSSGLTLRNVYLSNCNLNCAGADNNVSDVTVEISSGTWTAANSTTWVVRIGDSVSANQTVNNLVINAHGLDTGFVTANRGVLLMLGLGGAFRNLTLRVPQGLSQSFPHVDVYGSNLLIDGFVYDGPSYINVGTTAASSDLTVLNAVRTRSGGSATTQPFLYSNNAGTTRVTFQNIADFRDPGGSTPSVLVNGGTNFAAIGVVSVASAAQIVSTGGIVATFGCTKFNAPTQIYALSNVATNRTLDANTISTADLADVVGTLISDLRERLVVRF